MSFNMALTKDDAMKVIANTPDYKAIEAAIASSSNLFDHQVTTLTLDGSGGIFAKPIEGPGWWFDGPTLIATALAIITR